MAKSGAELLREGIELVSREEVEGRWLGDELVALFELVDRLRAECSRRVGEFDAPPRG